MMKTKTEKTPLMTAVAFGPTLALCRGYFYSKEPRNQGRLGANIPEFLNSLDNKITRIYSKEPRNQGNIIPKFPNSLDNKITRIYSKEPRNQGNNPEFLNSLDKIISCIYFKEPRNQGNIIPKFPDSLDNKIARSF